MPAIEPRKNSRGKIISFRIVVSDGTDSNGNRIRHRTFWTPPRPDMTAKQMEKEAMAAAFKFEEQIKNGFYLDNNLTFAEYANYVIAIKEQAGVRPRTIDRYIELLPRINQAIGHLLLVKIRPDHLNAFYKELLENTEKKGQQRARSRGELLSVLEHLDIPNAAVAREAGLAASTLTCAVRGDAIKVSSAEAICKVLEYKLDELFQVEENKASLAPKTVLEHHRLISTILHQAEKEMLVTYNAAARATPPKVERGRANYYQPNEMDQILDALESAPLKWKTITYLMIDTGCRRGEIMGLKWESIDMDTGVIMVENALLYTKSKGTYNGPTKTGRVRALKLAPQCMDLINKWKEAQLELKEKCGDRWEENGYVFTRDDGRTMNPESITAWLRKFSEEQNLPHINPHAFRHTAASTMIANGVDIVTAANELGHANATTTANIYAHQIALAKAKAAEARAGVFSDRDKVTRRRRNK